MKLVYLTMEEHMMRVRKLDGKMGLELYIA